jgi:8-amino-7-oxononanoate synthase
MREIRQSRTADRLQADLRALRAAEQFRDLSDPPGIQLCSNDYLGLSTHPLLKAAIVEAVEDEGRVASTGSRLLSGNSERWEKVEAAFAQYLGVESALYFPSGYAANIGLLSSVVRPQDIIFSDSANHASLIDGIRLSGARRIVFPHLDLNYLQDALKRETGLGEKFVVVESLFSMDGDHAPIRELTAICDRYDAALIVDEAHATGVEGFQGRGVVASAGRADCVLATVHTCGKALASMGAFVAGSRTLRDFLINRARTFIFTTGLPPYCAAHVQEALNLAVAADAERQGLTNLSRHLHQRLQSSGLDTGNSDSQIIPIILGSNDVALRFAERMRAAGFAIRAIRPPSVPPGTARLRVSLTANLSLDEIDMFADSVCG